MAAPPARAGGRKSFRDSEQSQNCLVQGLELALLQLQPVHPKSSRQNRKRAEVRPGPGFTLVHRMSSLSRKSSCRELSRQLRLGYFFFFLERIKVWRLIQLKTKQEEELSRLERTLGTFLNPLIYLFGRVGLGLEGRKRG